MSAFTDRIALLEKRIALLERERYSAPARRVDEELRRSVQRSDREWVTCPLDFYAPAFAAGTAIPNPVGGATIDADARTAIGLIITRLGNVSALAPAAAFGRTVYQSKGASRVFSVVLNLGAAWTKNGTNYWTIALRAFTPGATLGRTLATIDLSALSFAAGETSVYSDPVGFATSDGERLRALVTPTGSPAALTDAVLFAEVQRNARPT